MHNSDNSVVRQEYLDMIKIFFNNYTLPPKEGYDPADWRSKLSLAENMCSEAGVIFYGFDKQLNLVNSNADSVLL